MCNNSVNRCTCIRNNTHQRMFVTFIETCYYHCTHWLSVIAGLDRWTGPLDWTTGLTFAITVMHTFVFEQCTCAYVVRCMLLHTNQNYRASACSCSCTYISTQCVKHEHAHAMFKRTSAMMRNRVCTSITNMLIVSQSFCK